MKRLIRNLRIALGLEPDDLGIRIQSAIERQRKAAAALGSRDTLPSDEIEGDA